METRTDGAFLMIKETKYKDYYVDEDGNVYSNKYKKLVMLKQMNTTFGYKMLTINRKKIKVHRLIAETFIPNPQNKRCIDHINAIKTDNRVSNLRWVTYQQNYHNPITQQRLKLSINSVEHKAKMKYLHSTNEYKKKLGYKRLALQINKNDQCYINMNLFGKFDCYQLSDELKSKLKAIRNTDEYKAKMSKAKTKYNYQQIKHVIDNKSNKTWDQLSEQCGIPKRTLQKIKKKMQDSKILQSKQQINLL